MTRSPDRIRRVSVERTIAAPAASVFAALTDPSTHAVIDGSGALLLANAATPTPRLQAGSVFVTPMSRRLRRLTRVDVVQVAVAMLVRGRMRNTVVEFDEDRRIAWRNFGHHVWRYELQADEGSRTVVRQTLDYATNLTPWLLEWAGFPAHNRRAMNKTLAALDGLLTTTSK
jgi:hypothetical protein